jgi:phosphoribosylglycinamide formyltransferase-1
MGRRVAVLASGAGTNLQALLDDATVGPCVALVVSDRANASALDRARARAIEAVVLERSAFATREAHEEALLVVLRSRGIDVVVLAGYMRILGPRVVEAFRDRMLNVHPALLPSFPGTSAIADALAAGVKVTGVTVHLVDEEMDHGPIVLQEAVTVRDDDTAGSLEARLHEVEHRLLPAAAAALLEGRLRVRGDRAAIEADGA